MINKGELLETGKIFIRRNRIIIAILLLAAATRLVALNKIPSGMLPDEAYGAYNAWGLMTEGLDSRGYRYPVYFVAWGSGMSVLYSYLAIPMFRLFGVNLLAYRLPQAIIGILSVYAIYQLGKELFSTKVALLLSFALAVNPWHIMNMRFGLDANMAPGMFLIGLMFLILGIKKKNSYLIGTAFFWGGCALQLCSYLDHDSFIYTAGNNHILEKNSLEQIYSCFFIAAFYHCLAFDFVCDD